VLLLRREAQQQLLECQSHSQNQSRFFRQYRALLTTPGQLVLSGILKEQADSVSACYQSRFAINSAIIQDDWCRLDGIKK
jgi:ribosomal protein L11 methylase PrmA